MPGLIPLPVTTGERTETKGERNWQDERIGRKYLYTNVGPVAAWRCILHVLYVVSLYNVLMLGAQANLADSCACIRISASKC